MAFNVTLIGQLMISELIVLGILPILLIQRRNILKETMPKRIMLLGALWLLNQIISDIVAGTSFQDFARGWASVAFTMADFICIYLLAENKLRRVQFMLLGYAVGSALVTLLSPGISTIRWKMGGGDALILGALVLMSFWTESDKAARIGGIWGSLMGSVLSFVFDARNLAGRGIVNAGMLIAHGRASGKYFQNSNIRRSLLMLCVITVPMGYTILTLYGTLAQNGLMGEKARAIYAIQSNANFGAFGVLLGGRAEFFISTQAIADSPIIGHGSWAKSLYYFLKYRDLAKLGFDVSQSGVDDPEALLGSRGRSPEIPAHSILFQSWVWAGIMGGIFWIYILYYSFRFLVTIIYLKNSIVPVAIHIATMFIWDILYSPFGNSRRYEAAVIITAMLCLTKIATELRGEKSAIAVKQPFNLLRKKWPMHYAGNRTPMRVGRPWEAR